MELVALTLGQPHKLFAGVGAGLLFGGGRLEADADGHRLLMAKSAGETTTETGITLVESWFSEFKRK